MRTIDDWVSQYTSEYPKIINISYDKDVSLGEGETHYDDNGVPIEIMIGMSSLNMLFHKYLPISDADFVKMGVTTFHELTHCRRSLYDDTPKEILVSDLSKCYNQYYYDTVHHLLPHEIDAEYGGVMPMWSILEDEWPDDADSLMFEYLNNKTRSSERTKSLYVIEHPEGGFRSKQQVKDLFDEAYERSLAGKRRLPDTFFNIDITDDVSRLLTADSGFGIRPEYAPLYLMLSKAETGADFDKMMASFVCHIHPELQTVYPHLDFNDFSGPQIFRMPMPETTDESRMRLDYENSFTIGIDEITRLRDDSLQL